MLAFSTREIMLLEIDEVAVDPKDGVEELRRKLHGLVVYFHAFGGPEQASMEVRTIRQLEDMGVIRSVTLNTQDYNGVEVKDVPERRIRFLGDLQRLTLKPGDHFVLTLPGIVPDETAERIRNHFENTFNNEHKVLVLSEGMKLGIIGK